MAQSPRSRLDLVEFVKLKSSSSPRNLDIELVSNPRSLPTNRIQERDVLRSELYLPQGLAIPDDVGAAKLKSSGSPRKHDIELLSSPRSLPIREHTATRNENNLHYSSAISDEGGSAARGTDGARVVHSSRAQSGQGKSQGSGRSQREHRLEFATASEGSTRVNLHGMIPSQDDQSTGKFSKQMSRPTKHFDSVSRTLHPLNIAGPSEASLTKQSSFRNPIQQLDSAVLSVPLQPKELYDFYDDRVISSFQEQKNWISSALTAASAAGEENIQFQFLEDKHLSEGCSSCGPDYTHSGHNAVPQIWRSDRKALWVQSCCWKLYNSFLFKWIFRGDAYNMHSQYPSIEPCQKFKCGWKMMQERSCVLIFLFLTLVSFSVGFFPVFLRLNTSFQIANVDYSRISHFRISCNGCKIQITNHNDFAGYFSPCNLNMFFPSDGSYDTDSYMTNECRVGRAPNFCDYSSGVCNLEIRHRASVSFSSIKNILSMEAIDDIVYPWPTVDLIIPSDWTGTLELINPGSASANDVSREFNSPEDFAAIPLIVVPFNSKSFTYNLLNTMIDKKLLRATLIREVVSLPNLIIQSSDSLAPVLFLGNRGGSFKNVSMKTVTGMFSARDVSFSQNSKVSLSIPQGDVIFNTENHIATNLVSLYSATAPVVLGIFPPAQPAASVTSFTLTLRGINFRHFKSGDITLSFQGIASAVRIPDCILSFPTNIINTVGSVVPINLVFLCVTRFTESSNDLEPYIYNIFLNYFGGSMRLPYSFQLNVLLSNGIITISNLNVLPRNTSALPRPSANPNNVCAVGGKIPSISNTLTSSGFAPSTTIVELIDFPVLISTPGSSVGPSVTFLCTAARSLSLGSHPYSYGNQPDPVTQLGKFPTMHQPSTTFSYEDVRANEAYLPDLSPEVMISYQDQAMIALFARKVLNNSLDYLIINVFGSGANLPGFFIFTLKSIYTVMDPAIIQTLTFGLLPISRAAINVHLSPGLCPDFSEVTVDNANPAKSEGKYSSVRISQVYSVLEAAIRSAISDGGLTSTLELPSFAITFRFRLAGQVWAAVFQIVERVSTSVGTTLTYYSLLYDGSLKINPSASSLITLSIILPIVVAFALASFAAVALTNRVEELRNNFFLSSIEGSRLSSIDIFRGLAWNSFALKTHVSKLASQAPPAANLQNRHSIKLLKFFELFEIVSKVPQEGAKYQEWYIKIRRGRFAFFDVIKNSLQSLFSDLLDSVPGYDLLSSNQQSFMNIFFKKVTTKFTRKLIFPKHILDQLECNPNDNLRDLLKIPEVDRMHNNHASGSNGATRISCKVTVLKKCDSHLDGKSPVSQQTEASFSVCGCDSMYVATTALCVCVPKSRFLDMQDYLHVGVGVHFSRIRHDRHVPFPTEGERKFVISNILKNGENCAHIELECLNPLAFVDMESFKTSIHLTMYFDDPLVVDDDAMTWFKSKNLLNSKTLKSLIGRVISDDVKELANVNAYNQNIQNPANQKKIWRKKDFVLTYNPYEHRSLIVLTTIFYDACEAYRNIVSATGVEFFMDLILVNGAANMKKWRKFGSISEVQSFRDENSVKADAQQTAVQPEAVHSMNSQMLLDASKKAISTQPTSIAAEEGSINFANRMPVVDIRIPVQISKSHPIDKKYVVLTLPDSHVDLPLLKSPEGQAGSFFSIHSTNQQPVTCALNLSDQSNHCCLCCSYTTATLEERWTPYKPGEVYFVRTNLEGVALHPAPDVELPCEGKKVPEKFCLGEQHFSDGKLVNPYTQTSPISLNGTISSEDDNKKFKKFKCGVAAVEFNDLIKYIEYLDTNEDGSRSATSMFSSEMLSYYRPKGRLAILSPLLHVALIIGACIPTLALFTLWGLNQYAFYYYTITQTAAAGFLFVCFYFVGAGFIYLVIVYLDFPYLFFGRKCCNRIGFGHFFFTPVTGILFPILRRVFYSAFGLILVVDLACIFLALMWIALGVVVNPALAIPYATGILVFLTNLNSVRNSLTNWQQMIVDEVLDLLLPYIKSQISNHSVKDVLVKIIDEVTDGIRINNEVTSDCKPIVDTLYSLKDTLLASNPQDSIVLRKLKEGEISMLLRSLWTSIREELGLSERNIFIGVIVSSLILGLLLIFIFIGVSVFADSKDPFASVVNSLLTVGAGLGVNSNFNMDKGAAPEGERHMIYKLVVEKFCLLLQTRLKNSYAIFVKILALASCAESEAAMVLQCIMQASDKFRDPSNDDDGGRVEPEEYQQDVEVDENDEDDKYGQD